MWEDHMCTKENKTLGGTQANKNKCGRNPCKQKRNNFGQNPNKQKSYMMLIRYKKLTKLVKSNECANQLNYTKLMTSHKK